MPNITIGFAIALILLGLGGYVPTGAKTALIPAGFGIALLICGLLAKKENLRKHAMHAAAVLALLGFLGSAGRVIPALARGADITAPAMIAQSLMAVLMLVYEILCVRSFIAARRNR